MARSPYSSRYETGLKVKTAFLGLVAAGATVTAFAMTGYALARSWGAHQMAPVHNSFIGMGISGVGGLLDWVGKRVKSGTLVNLGVATTYVGLAFATVGSAEMIFGHNVASAHDEFGAYVAASTAAGAGFGAARTIMELGRS